MSTEDQHRIAELEAELAALRAHKISDPTLHALHENAKAYSLANTALREVWGFTHSTSLAFLIKTGMIGPTGSAYVYTPPPGFPGGGPRVLPPAEKGQADA